MTDTRSIKPLPCPFCGGRAVVFQNGDKTAAACAKEYDECPGADAWAPVDEWNRRSHPPSAEPSLYLAPVLERLQAWRNTDHEDAVVLTRHEVITLVEAAKAPAPQACGMSEEALRNLVAALEKCHEDSRYKAAWHIAHLHLGPYSGPTYAAELEAARAVLAALKTKMDGGAR